MFKKRNDFIYVQKFYPDKVYKHYSISKVEKEQSISFATSDKSNQDNSSN